MIKKVLIDHQVDLSEIFKHNLGIIANELFQADIITYEMYKTPTFDSIMGNFFSLMGLKNIRFELEEHCSNFLKALFIVGGPAVKTANEIQEEWIAAVDYELCLRYQFYFV